MQEFANKYSLLIKKSRATNPGLGLKRRGFKYYTTSKLPGHSTP